MLEGEEDATPRNLDNRVLKIMFYVGKTDCPKRRLKSRLDCGVNGHDMANMT